MQKDPYKPRNHKFYRTYQTPANLPEMKRLPLPSFSHNFESY